MWKTIDRISDPEGFVEKRTRSELQRTFSNNMKRQRTDDRLSRQRYMENEGRAW